MNLSELSAVQLHQIIAIKERIEGLRSQLESPVDSDRSIPARRTTSAARAKRKLSAAHKRKLINALAKARVVRWGNAKTSKPAKKKDKRSSAATRAKLSAAAKARWANAKAEEKSGL